MPPRYAYWTILVDGQPTAFRAGAQDDLMPTFKRLKEKHPSAEMKWFQNGKLWNSRLDAQEAMRARGEMGRRGDSRQGAFRDRKRLAQSPTDDKLAWTPKGDPADPASALPPRRRERSPEWTPKGTFDRDSRSTARPRPANDRHQLQRPTPQDPSGKPTLDWKPKGEFTPAPPRAERVEWTRKPKGEFTRDTKRPWTPSGSKGAGYGGQRRDRSESRGGGDRAAGPKAALDWKPKGQFTPAPKRRTSNYSTTPPLSEGKRKWIPKEEYKRSQGIEARRDKNWRPGGEHKDPRQKYKDAKKAKWTRFKKQIRARSESKPGKKKSDS